MAMPDNSRNRGRDYGSRNGRGYIGRISNDGAQRVEAPIDPNGKRGKEIGCTARKIPRRHNRGEQ